MWENASGFAELCANTSVEDGAVHGQVLEMDLIRNPGVSREGPETAQKTIRGLYQRCYATSCSVPLLQEMTLRNWYKTDASLDAGIVVWREPDVAAPWDVRVVTWPAWEFLLAVFAAILAVVGLIACFMLPKQRSKFAGEVMLSERIDHAEHDETDDRELQEVQPMPNLLRPPAWQRQTTTTQQMMKLDMANVKPGPQPSPHLQSQRSWPVLQAAPVQHIGSGSRATSLLPRASPPSYQLLRTVETGNQIRDGDTRLLAVI